MTPDQFEVYRRCTARSEAPTKAATESWLVCGRRSGKSFTLALIAVYLACFGEYRRYLAPGERGTVIIVATNRSQARVIVIFCCQFDIVGANAPLGSSLERRVGARFAKGFRYENSR